MNKILLIGEFSEEMSKLREELIDVPNIQLCSLNRDNIRGVIKIINPDIVIACMVETEADISDKAIFKWLKDSWPKLPVLVTSSEEYWERLKVLYNIGEWKHMYFPINKGELLKTCSSMVGQEAPTVEESKGAEAEVPEEAVAKASGEPSEESSEETATKGSTSSNTEKKPTKKRILIVDDSALILRTIKGILDQKYTVSLANSGLTAISKLAKEIPDLILLDYEMPEMDGLEVYNRIRENPATEKLPVIFLTSVTDRSRVIPVLKQNPAGYIVKPPSRDQLLNCIKDVLGN